MVKCIGLPCANDFFIDNNIGIYWTKQDDTEKEPIVQLNDCFEQMSFEHSSQATASMFWAKEKKIYIYIFFFF